MVVSVPIETSANKRCGLTPACFFCHPDTDPWLIFADQQSIRKVTVDGQQQQHLLNYVAARVLNFDYQEEQIYFSDFGSDAIKRVDISGDNVVTIDQHFSLHVQGLAVDWVGRYVSVADLENCFLLLQFVCKDYESFSLFCLQLYSFSAVSCTGRAS